MGFLLQAVIIGGMMVEQCKVPDGIKGTSKIYITYITFLEDNLHPLFQMQNLSFKRKLVFMQDNALSHAAKDSKVYMQKIGFSGGCLMEWLPCLHDLNLIKNLLSDLIGCVSQDGLQFSSKDALCDAIVDAAESMTQEDIITSINSMNQHVRKVIAYGGSYIKH